MAVGKYEHPVVRGAIHFLLVPVVVELASFLSQILYGDVGARRFRTWPPRFVPGHPIL